MPSLGPENRPNTRRSSSCLTRPSGASWT